jgi:hypothetical protein
MDLTLLEVHLDGATFTANAPFAAEEADVDDETDDETSLPPFIPFVVVVVVLAGLAYLVRRWRSGDEPAEIEPTVTETDVATA